MEQSGIASRLPSEQSNRAEVMDWVGRQLVDGWLANQYNAQVWVPLGVPGKSVHCSTIGGCSTVSGCS